MPRPNIHAQDARVLHPHRDMNLFTNSIFFFSFYRWSVGSLLFLLSWAVLMGPWTYARHLVSGPRLPFTAAYFGSIALTLYFAIGVSTFSLFSATCCICSIQLLLVVGFWSRPLRVSLSIIFTTGEYVADHPPLIAACSVIVLVRWLHCMSGGKEGEEEENLA